MLSDIKKPVLNEKKAFYYFGFKTVVPFSEVEKAIKALKNVASDELAKTVNDHAENIESYFDNDDLKNDETLSVKFNRGEPRKSWASYKDDFPEINLAELIENEESEDAIEVVEKEAADEIDVIEEADIEPVVEEKPEVKEPVVKNSHPKTKIYINGELLGSCEDPVNFTQQMREKRRNGEVSHEMNITYYEDNNEIYIFNDPGRARRPLIIVKDGVPLLKEEHLNKVANGKLKWDDLINNGLIEYLDAEEEENSYISMSLAEINEDHTHLEIDPATMLGICAGIIPFSDHNSSPRNTMEAGMTKQALGLYVSNYALRTDTRAHLLHHPQTPIVKTRIIDSTNYDLRPSGQTSLLL